MRALLLAAATALAAVAATPAAAQSRDGHRHHHGQWLNLQGFETLGRHLDRDDRRDRRRHRRDHRGDRHDDPVLIGDPTWNEGWAWYNNRSFAADSFNGWWHDRPDRAYPRWVQSRSCDRMWWGGGTWRCSW